MKKILTFFLALVLIGFNTNITNATQKKEMHGTYYSEPEYADNDVEGDYYIEPDPVVIPSGATEDGITYCTTFNEAGKKVRTKLKARSKNFSVNIKFSTSTTPSAAADKMVDIATAYTGVSDEGDYLWRNMSKWGVGWSGYQSGDYYYLVYSYSVSYYASAAKEKEVTSKVKSILKSLDISSSTDYQKVKAIHNYICKHTKYDSNFDNSNRYSAYGCLIDNECVCQGYALAFYRLCLEAGVNARYIRGIADGGKHGWNIVQVGTKYYNVDCTWDSDPYTTSYFLLCDKTISKDHTRNSQFATTSFYEEYPMYTSNFSICDSHSISEGSSTSGTYYTTCSKGDAKVRVKLSTNKFVYDGSSHNPTVTVRDISNGEDISFTSTGSKATAIGVYEKIVKVGTKSFTMKWAITPKSVGKPTISLNSYNSINVKWNASSGATGYVVYYKVSTSSAWSSKKTTNTSITLSSLKAGAYYNIKVVPYVSGDGLRYNSNDTVTIVSTYTLKKLSAPTITKYSSSKVKVTWTNISGETGYQISKSTSSTGTNIVATYATTDGTYKTITATQNTTYYYKVRAYRVVNGTNIYGPWSNVTSYKLK